MNELLIGLMITTYVSLMGIIGYFGKTLLKEINSIKDNNIKINNFLIIQIEKNKNYEDDLKEIREEIRNILLLISELNKKIYKNNFS